MPSPVIELTDIALAIESTSVLSDVSWTVMPGERWVVMGANGSGKTSLLKIASLQTHPSNGVVTVLGETLGKTDLRELKKSIGFASHAVFDQLRANITVAESVVTGKNAALETWWHSYTDADFKDAEVALTSVGLAGYSRRILSSLSVGERQRVLLARALFNKPKLLILDEPTAGLDLPGREELIQTLEILSSEQPNLAIIMVTHFVEEIPPSFSHILFLKNGSLGGVGPIETELNSEVFSSVFEVKVNTQRTNQRWRTEMLA